MTLSFSIHFPSLLFGIGLGYVFCALFAGHVVKKVVDELFPEENDDGNDGDDGEPEPIESDEVGNDNLRHLVQQQRKRG